MIKDSGNRREFTSGAVRDIQEGKGDMVSLPNAAILRLSKHYEAGAKKYGRWNYTKGIPVSSFMDSALRHIFKYLDGWDDEDHLAALKGKNITVQDALMIAQIQKALKGDTTAAVFIRDTAGQNPTTKIETDIDMDVNITIDYGSETK